MNTLLLISIIICSTMQSVVRKVYNDKVSGGGVFLFSTLTSLSAMMFFVLNAKGYVFNIQVLPYSIAFAIAYATATVFLFIALSCGSLSLTTLIVSYSLMMPTIYGLLFLKEPVSFGLYPGMFLLVISLVLINKKNDKLPITLKWVISVIITFAGNGMCSVIQKAQQIKFDGAYKNELMILALLLVTISLFIFSLKKERKNMNVYFKNGLILSVLCGLMNGVTNLFVMILSGRMPVSVMFPLTSAGGIVVTYIISRFYYKEQLSKRQLTGFVLGIFSVVFLSM